MRDYNRRQVAQAKSRRASPEELSEARKRLKEIDEELRQIELTPEAKHGEERERRYERVVRLRAMRDEFAGVYPIREAERPNSLILALVMTVASFLLCTFCAGSVYGIYSILNQKPDPVASASAFWDDMEHQQYSDIKANYLSPALRVQLQDTLIVTAEQADKDYGVVSNAVLVGKPVGDLTQHAVLTYSVTRNPKVTYIVKLVLDVHGGRWGVSDLGGATTPVTDGVAPVATATPIITPSVTPKG